MAILEVSSLKKYFPIKGGFFGKTVGHVHAVDDVSFSIESGSTLGLVGESGCGKSTLGRTILRLYEPTAGKIHFDGQDISDLSSQKLRSLRKEMQIIFQDPYSSLNPRMTIQEIVGEPFIIHKLCPRKEIRDRVAHLLGTVGMQPDYMGRYPHEFSGGQRQRIGIARALALEPKLIVADEPVSALDVSIQSQILNLLVDLRTKFGLTFLFISHDLAVIEHISDQIAVMYLGKIVELSSAQKLYATPVHPYTKALIASIPSPSYKGKQQKANVLKGDVPSPINPPPGCAFHPRCPLTSERCRKETPELRQIGSETDKQWVSCHNV